MKKLLLMLAIASFSVAGMAQNESETPALKHSVATNSFWSNWFIQANVAGSAFYGNQEHGSDLSKSPLKDFRNNLGFSVAVSGLHLVSVLEQSSMAHGVVQSFQMTGKQTQTNIGH